MNLDAYAGFMGDLARDNGWSNDDIIHVDATTILSSAVRDADDPLPPSTSKNQHVAKAEERAFVTDLKVRGF